jgi:hypothetical protein
MTQISNQQVTSGVLNFLDRGGHQEFQYNPESIEERESARWANIAIQGMHNPRLQYSSGDGRTITFTLKMYHVDKSGRTPGDRINELRSLVYPDTKAGMPGRPPTRVALVLGPDYPGVNCIVTEVQVKSDKFDRTNAIRYSEVTLTLLQIESHAIDYSEVL